MKALHQSKPAFANSPKGKNIHWIKPELVCEVEFTEFTSEKILRHPSFKGLREDKDGKSVQIERAEKIEPQVAKKKKTDIDEVVGVPITNPDRILYPEQGITKLELMRYYEQIADWILPYIVKRPLTLVRCPQGRQHKCFFQKHINEGLPEFIRGISIKEKEGEEVYLLIDDLPGLIALVQLGVLEFHVWGSLEDKVEYPDQMIFDLDPGEDVSWREVIKGARSLRQKLESIDLISFVKTSGGKGLHVVVPLQRRADWDEVKEFSRAVADEMVSDEPDKFIATMSKARRQGKIFIDYLRNGRGATSIVCYSTRARAGATVSAAVAWEELSDKLTADAFNIRNLPQRLTRLKKDPWQDFFKIRQGITASMKKKIGIR